MDDFPQGVDKNDSCFYASAYGSDKRVFLTPPVYQHSIGCPHIHIPGQEDEHHHANEGDSSDQHDIESNTNSVAV